MDWLFEKAKPVSKEMALAAEKHQQDLTKPAGSLGQLEKLAIHLASLQNRINPCIEKPAIIIFAADHGVVEESVSAFPQEVTAQMIQNFLDGGAAISVLANKLNARFQVINLGTITPLPEHDNLQQYLIAQGTNNFCKEPAMTDTELEQAINIGKKIIDQQVENQTDLFIGGEMGIGNTTSATALACSLLNNDPGKLVGLGTGIDENGLLRKTKAIKHALELHKTELTSPINCLQFLGGFEIAALVSSYIRSAQRGIPVLIDGYICTVAALVAIKINSSVKAWFIYSHESAETGHRAILEALNATPLLKLDMRLGEASGAAVALPLLTLACELHNEMATFSSAEISNKTNE